MNKTRSFHARALILLSAVAVAGCVTWAGFAQIDQVSRATGQVIPAGRVQVIQSLDGGVIAAINVREGDRVRKGQVLVSLDRVKISAAVDEGRAKVAALKTTRARLEAELFNRPLSFPQDVQDFPELVANQRALFSQRRNAYNEDIAALRRMLELVRQELAMNMPLLQYGDVSRSEILRLQRSVADIEGQIATHQNKYLQDLQTEYTKVGEDLITAQETLTQRQASLADTELEASTDGIVKNVHLTTVGGVLRPGDEVLQIVPTGEELLVEAKVSPADIAYVRVGQPASVKFDAYDSSIYGSATGSVVYISPDTLTEQRPSGEQVFYRVHIRADTRKMNAHGPQAIQLQPGMTATNEIITGRNTVLKFLLKPIIKTFHESFGER
ncbi:MAG: hypothetical protein RLZZ08_1133 [Pseudomonadota bacterium]|jgi:adhesin transport system membrane fusion protein